MSDQNLSCSAGDQLAGIPKIDERGRSVDVHAVRHTFATMLSTSGVSPRVAQEAMRHSTMELTMKVYTDPKLLDVAGAIASLPAMNSRPISMKVAGTGTDGKKSVALTVAPAGVL
ncbi:MAG TPA: tyrosine-type recombinase/integrase [Pirellula sp.]|nr:tyrosine-type recombinase/integrase [Pirellula sp.]